MLIKCFDSKFGNQWFFFSLTSSKINHFDLKHFTLKHTGTFKSSQIAGNE